MLRAGKSHGDIRDFLITNNEEVPARYALSRHSIHHLKLESRAAQKKQDTDVATMEVPAMEELRDETLKILFWRMKNRPDQVDTRELVSVLGHVTKAMEPPAKPHDDLAARLAQISNANQTP
jgi:hypothetical protein